MGRVRRAGGWVRAEAVVAVLQARPGSAVPVPQWLSWYGLALAVLVVGLWLVGA